MLIVVSTMKSYLEGQLKTRNERFLYWRDNTSFNSGRFGEKGGSERYVGSYIVTCNSPLSKKQERSFSGSCVARRKTCST
mmetsp:Transcript_15625/g.43108  ORF Transcript_15625/g.43108 Transcript_15625/m.43108 type:complete len:80 (-) Transcript_15625:457-696(-)